MSTTETTSKAVEGAVENIRKAAESNLKLQQDMFQQWAKLWPGVPASQTDWMAQIREFQKNWGETFSDLAKKHREVLDQQYDAAVASLDDALEVAEAKDPEDFRERSEQFYRKTLDCLRKMSEAQIGEFQDAVKKWSELLTKSEK